MVEEPFDHLDCFLDLSVFVCVLVHSSKAVEKRKETFASMCDERARMLQDQFNVSMNHVQAMSIVISTFHHGKRLSAIDQDQDSNAHMAYWLSNTSMLLFLLQRTLKATGAKPLTPTSFFGRMTQGFRSSLSSANLSFCGLELYQVEAKYVALLFKQQLTTYVKKIYGIVRDNSKKDLSSLLSSCIQVHCLPKFDLSTACIWILFFRVTNHMVV
ncbi:myosin-7-like [Camellia sinensis]|uniref:myosin-7-like n=1 Tax=Camellia sinensis TaxID=4442 RepID=UPI0010369C07|nr:myosin-7-like [Camellia sinensis]XP_028063664.1 myosin-7-like [Camellia sinensis]